VEARACSSASVNTSKRSPASTQARRCAMCRMTSSLLTRSSLLSALVLFSGTTTSRRAVGSCMGAAPLPACTFEQGPGHQHGGAHQQHAGMHDSWQAVVHRKCAACIVPALPYLSWPLLAPLLWRCMQAEPAVRRACRYGPSGKVAAVMCC
jgi:hypothetical protein